MSTAAIAFTLSVSAKHTLGTARKAGRRPLLRPPGNWDATLFVELHPKKLMSLLGTDFIRRFLLNVLPHGLMRIRHYGFLANRCRGVQLAEIRSRHPILTCPAKYRTYCRQKALESHYAK